jgi:hypothetical protein
MVEQLSQRDLNALLGFAPEDGPQPPSAISQGDLDSFLAGLADFTPSTKPKGPVPVQEECMAPTGAETLSQDEIDRLLADFGK